MGNKTSRSSMPTSDNNVDVTEAIRKSVGVMIARAAVNKNKGKEFGVDLEQCKSFIKQQIELVPPTVFSKPDDDEIYGYISVVRKGIPRPIHVPISRTVSITDHGTAKHTLSSSRKTSRCGETDHDSPGNTKIETPSGKHICNLQLKLRALKKAKLEIYGKINPATGAAVGAVAGMFVPFVGDLIGSIAGGLASGGIKSGAVGIHLALDNITLTAEDIFKESITGDSANKIVEKGDYIHCTIIFSI
jgi:hypothetical protein